MQIRIPALGKNEAQTVNVDVDHAEQQLGRFFQAKRAEIMKETDALPKSEKWVRDQRLAGLDKEHNDLLKQVAEARSEREKARSTAEANERKHLTPHAPSPSDEAQNASEFKNAQTYIRNTATSDPTSHEADVVNSGPLRFLKDDAAKPIDDIARAIKVNNNAAVSAREAYEIALDVTRHVPDTVGGKALNPKQVPNGHVGKDGAYFKVVGEDFNNNPVIETSGGHRVTVPRATFNKIVGLKERSYEMAKKEEADAAKRKTKLEKGAEAAKELFTVPPEVIGGVP